MGASLESRLVRLENKIKALKATYQTAGALAKWYVVESPRINVGGSSSAHSVTIEFVPKYGLGRNNIMILTATTFFETSSGTIRKSHGYVTKPQDGSGKVAIMIDMVTNEDEVQVIASGTSPGSFEVVG